MLNTKTKEFIKEIFKKKSYYQISEFLNDLNNIETILNIIENLEQPEADRVSILCDSIITNENINLKLCNKEQISRLVKLIDSFSFESQIAIYNAGSSDRWFLEKFLLHKANEEGDVELVFDMLVDSRGYDDVENFLNEKFFSTNMLSVLTVKDKHWKFTDLLNLLRNKVGKKTFINRVKIFKVKIFEFAEFVLGNDWRDSKLKREQIVFFRLLCMYYNDSRLYKLLDLAIKKRIFRKKANLPDLIYSLSVDTIYLHMKNIYRRKMFINILKYLLLKKPVGFEINKVLSLLTKEGLEMKESAYTKREHQEAELIFGVAAKLEQEFLNSFMKSNKENKKTLLI